MTNHDHHIAISRMVLTLDLIVMQWPEIRAQDLLRCAKSLAGIIAASPLRNATNSVAVGRYVEDLVDQKLLPAWCGMPSDAEEARLRAL